MKLKLILSVIKKLFTFYCLFWLLDHIFIYQYWCDDNTININLQWNQMLSLIYISYITTILFCWYNLNINNNNWIFYILILWNIINIINFNFSIDGYDQCLYKVIYYEEIVWCSLIIITLLTNYIYERNKHSHIQFTPMIHKNEDEAADENKNNTQQQQQQEHQMITLDLDHDSSNNSRKEANDILIDEEDII